jgi:RNA polymerase sigma-70 factor, ECF subfamily
LTAENKSESTQRFYDLVWPHRATVLRVANILAGKAAEAEDLAQETLLKAFRALHTLRDESDVRAWLLAILRHARVDQLRSAGRSAGTLSLDAIEIEPTQPGDTDPASHGSDDWERPEEILNAFSDQQVIDALQKLPEDIRLTLLLVDIEQLDHSEAAALLAVPLGTIKSRTHRGRAMLRQVLVPVAREMGILSR